MSFEVQASETILDLKLRIQDKDGRILERETLVFNNKQLDNSNTMSSYGIQQDPTLHLVRKTPFWDKFSAQLPCDGAPREEKRPRD
jgi:hypothetical protein